MADPVKVEIVGPVMTNTNDPWRTQGDYREEQQESRERHAMLQEQHRLITKSIRWNIVLAVATVVMAVATVALVFVTISEKPDKTSPQTVQVPSPQVIPSQGQTK